MNSTRVSPRQAFAVSLAESERAILTASGEAKFAEQIIALAGEHGIPVQSEPGLVKLFSSVPAGGELPAELLQAISEVIAFLYELEQEGDDDTLDIQTNSHTTE